jgi:uncharacterized protein (DUF488 family)
VDETIWTIGHSTRPIEDFIALLRANEIETVADVRRFPSSRWHPQYNERNLRESLAAEGVGYVWIPALGGRRVPLPNSPNTAWRNEAFRGYADHIATEEFAGGLFELLMVAGGRRTAIMCSEAVWWRCHRSIIADVLRSLGKRVLHIVNASPPREHEYRAPAKLIDAVLTYAS